MKILDKYILTTYLKTFFSVFIILMLIFILQSVWLYIRELAGKDLEIDIILRFLINVTPRLVVLVLPLTILLSSIMVFGKFAENYEFAAMKSTGISLQRAMKTLSVFILGLSIVTFFFANNVIPAAEFNFYNLRRNIAQLKPSAVIAEGQFNQIGPTVNIKVEEKSGDRGQFLKNVIIHQKENEKDKKISSVTIAKTGELVSSINSNVIKLVLFDANTYKNVEQANLAKKSVRQEFIKSNSKAQTLFVDLSGLNDVDFKKESSVKKYSMFGVKALDSVIDTLRVVKRTDFERLSKNLFDRSRVSALNTNINPKKDTLYKENDFLKIFEPQQRVQLLNLAINSSKSTIQIIENNKRTFLNKERNLNKTIISYYEKYALAIMCVILFFVGAPLGALIKKGGIGLPIVIAVLIFLTYHFIGIFAKNSAEDSSVNPIFATWLPTLVMLPLGIYFTSRATKDRSLIDIDELLSPLKKLVIKEAIPPIKDNSILEETSESYLNLNTYDDKKLIDIVKNFHLYPQAENYRNTALKILNLRGYREQELKFSGNLTNENYTNALRYKSSYEENSKMSIFLYFVGITPSILGAILKNNGFSVLGKTLLGIGIFFMILFLITYFKSVKNQFNFNKLKGKKLLPITIISIILGIPFYFIHYIYHKNRMNKGLKLIK
ncbi:LptF/LptG family permease [Flavobacteriaceae bacterium AU392]|nr:YjgP/YjgQ family permease [Flavobacteriaceae bacterium]RKM86545.1 LptF/LptG family permease [Flavobacteriaceae bacterium AU392]